MNLLNPPKQNSWVRHWYVHAIVVSSVNIYIYIYWWHYQIQHLVFTVYQNTWWACTDPHGNQVQVQWLIRHPVELSSFRCGNGLLRSEEEQEERRLWFGGGSNRSSGMGAMYLGTDYEFSSTSGYPHNTYHGPARHLRPLLNSLGQDPEGGTKPLRFTDSPQHYVMAQGGTPTPSPRRKSSSTSNEGSEVSRCK